MKKDFYYYLPICLGNFGDSFSFRLWKDKNIKWEKLKLLYRMPYLEFKYNLILNRTFFTSISSEGLMLQLSHTKYMTWRATRDTSKQSGGFKGLVSKLQDIYAGASFEFQKYNVFWQNGKDVKQFKREELFLEKFVLRTSKPLTPWGNEGGQALEVFNMATLRVWQVLCRDWES